MLWYQLSSFKKKTTNGSLRRQITSKLFIVISEQIYCHHSSTTVTLLVSVHIFKVNAVSKMEKSLLNKPFPFNSYSQSQEFGRYVKMSQ